MVKVYIVSGKQLDLNSNALCVKKLVKQTSLTLFPVDHLILNLACTFDGCL